MCALCACYIQYKCERCKNVRQLKRRRSSRSISPEAVVVDVNEKEEVKDETKADQPIRPPKPTLYRRRNQNYSANNDTKSRTKYFARKKTTTKKAKKDWKKCETKTKTTSTKYYTGKISSIQCHETETTSCH